MTNTSLPSGEPAALSHDRRSLRAPRPAAWTHFGLFPLLRITLRSVSDNQDGRAFAHPVAGRPFGAASGRSTGDVPAFDPLRIRSADLGG